MHFKFSLMTVEKVDLHVSCISTPCQNFLLLCICLKSHHVQVTGNSPFSVNLQCVTGPYTCNVNKTYQCHMWKDKELCLFPYEHAETSTILFFCGLRWKCLQSIVHWNLTPVLSVRMGECLYGHCQ